MKKLGVRFLFVILYLFVVLVILNFNIRTFIDLKSLALVTGGTIFLSLSSLKKGMKKQEIYSLISWNAFVVSYLITFIYLFVNLSQRTGSKDIFLEIALDSRALLYGFLIFILFKEGRSEDKKTILNNETENQKISAEEIYAFFREAGLTKREAEIARLARNGLSNREIAEEMYIAETTVKKHMSHIFEKLLIKSREELKEIVRVGRHKND